MDNFILDLEQKQTIRKGFLKQFTPSEFLVLLAIQAHTDIQQVTAYPSQETISEITDVGITTVKKSIKTLEEKGFISREKGIKGLTIYSIKDEPIKQVEPEPVDSDEPIKKYKTAKDFINQFCKLYFDHYSVNYSPNWSRDGSLVKNKLMGQYTDDQLDFVLSFTFGNFEKRYANKRFPRPTIGAITSFIVNDAIAQLQTEQKKEKELEQFEEFDLDKYFKHQQF